MFKKLVKKLAIGATLVCMAGGFVAASACAIESKHPSVRITVEFDDNTYELRYTLYRNMYPNTVRHFIELADNGYYDDMIVHDYRASDWLTGGFSYVADEYARGAESGSGALAEYLEEHSKEQSYMDLFEAGSLTPSVYGKYSYDEKHNQILAAEDALPTLIGEFHNNINQVIDNGALLAEFGALKMYYYSKDSTNKVYVTPTSDQNLLADYKKNCATSIFSIQVGSGSSIDEDDYCVFARLDNSEDLTKLMDAVEEYESDTGADAISVNDVSCDNLVEVFSDEASDRGIEIDVTLPASPIIIRTVKVTKR